MKKTSLLTLIAGLFLLTSGLLNAHAAPTNNEPETPPVYAREITLSQIYRYGREMYRTGNFTEAVAAFKRMITFDCRNALAHYHLQMISKKDARFAGLTDYLKGLSCTGYNFMEEDFLPAGALYEKDAALLQSQLAIYSQRARDAKYALSLRVKEYDQEVLRLEQELNDISKILIASRNEKKATLAAGEKLNDVLKVSRRINAEIARLQQDILADRERYQQQLLELKTTLLTKERGTVVNKAGAIIGSATSPSDENSSAYISEQDAALVTLQDKFNAIQERLKLIEASIKEKNQQLETLTNDLNAIRN